MGKCIVMLVAVVTLFGCSLNQVSQMAYDSVKGGECLDREGEINCDLADKDNEGMSRVGSADENTNEALEKKAKMARDQQNKIN